MNYKINAKENKNYLLEELSNENIKKSFLAEDADIYNDEIPSTKDIPENGSSYYAIVQSDGDNITEIIKSFKDDLDKASNFSELLNEYIIKANDILDDYGAFTIYAGGDDLLFFAPLNSKGRNIFQLINKLNTLFKNILNKNVDKHQSSLCFGISITHSDYPLTEALNEAQNLLFQDAKKFKKGNIKKNAIACQIIKYSGKSSKFTFNQEFNTYKIFNDLLNQKIDEEEFHIKSIKNDLRNGNILIEEKLKKNKKIEYYFENKYNKQIHKKYSNFIKLVIKLINEYSSEYNNNKLFNIYSILEIKDFVNEGGSNEV